MTDRKSIIQWLFQTQAIRVCLPDQPFWYTSGTLGPYYINTHFLYGSETSAKDLLALIESLAAEPLSLPPQISFAVAKQYNLVSVFKRVCDLLAGSFSAVSFDIVSGGERRDFFFSVQVANLLGKPHLSIMKNGTMILSQDHFTENLLVDTGDLAGSKVLHVADLVTEASSYQRAWLPSVRRAGADMRQTVTVIDRNQGGREWLAENNVTLKSLVLIDRCLFLQALAAGQINSDQFAMIDRFITSPRDFARHFLYEHPTFLEQQIALGGQNRERALLCKEKGYAE
ncbi:MAG: orotate phosphoribosyltransferase [Saccharofermentanales bacterium]|nr:orotate phosphoribosyltransferase [Clostridiaceae bacterium]